MVQKETELQNGESQLAAKEKELTAGEQQLQQKTQELTAGKQELAAKQKELTDGKTVSAILAYACKARTESKNKDQRSTVSICDVNKIYGLNS